MSPWLAGSGYRASCTSRYGQRPRAGFSPDHRREIVSFEPALTHNADLIQFRFA